MVDTLTGKGRWKNVHGNAAGTVHIHRLEPRDDSPVRKGFAFYERRALPGNRGQASIQIHPQLKNAGPLVRVHRIEGDDAIGTDVDGPPERIDHHVITRRTDDVTLVGDSVEPVCAGGHCRRCHTPSASPRRLRPK